MSWKYQVIADHSGQWADNAVRFATEAEAKEGARDLFMRWTSVKEWRVVESPDPVTDRWNSETHRAESV